MHDILEVELILNRKKYPVIYSSLFIILIIIMIFTYIIFTYKYQTYYVSKAKMIDNELELLVKTDDIKYLENNNILRIEDQDYIYKITKIDSNLYVSKDYNNYQYIYLKVNNLYNIDNYVYEVKIPKENKLLAKYLINYL